MNANLSPPHFAIGRCSPRTRSGTMSVSVPPRGHVDVSFGEPTMAKSKKKAEVFSGLQRDGRLQLHAASQARRREVDPEKILSATSQAHRTHGKEEVGSGSVAVGHASAQRAATITDRWRLVMAKRGASTRTIRIALRPSAGGGHPGRRGPVADLPRHDRSAGGADVPGSQAFRACAIRSCCPAAARPPGGSMRPWPRGSGSSSTAITTSTA